MRGTLADRANTETAGGIIPAYAGNTLLFYPASGLQWDHPRVCGEHHMPSFHVGVAQGSSPRMRGTLHLRFRHANDYGIIPAYAGNTAPPFHADVHR